MPDPQNGSEALMIDLHRAAAAASSAGMPRARVVKTVALYAAVEAHATGMGRQEVLDLASAAFARVSRVVGPDSENLLRVDVGEDAPGVEQIGDRLRRLIASIQEEGASVTDVVECLLHGFVTMSIFSGVSLDDARARLGEMYPRERAIYDSVFGKGPGSGS